MNFKNLKLRIEYYDLKYPYLKYIVLVLIITSLLRRTNILDMGVSLVILVISAVLHEIAHGYTAYYLGDDTAKRYGRLSLNPARHIDLDGLILPLILIFIGSPIIFGSAKPVPVNYNNLRKGKFGIIAVSLAGVTTNILLAILATIVLKYLIVSNLVGTIFFKWTISFVYINISLAVFNLIPIPPLDGSRVLRVFSNYETKRVLDRIESSPLSFFFILLILQTNIFSNLISGVARYILGIFL